MSLQPLVSVCIPCYNSEEFIASTVESVLNQTLGDFELLVSDNRSTDSTYSILRTFKDGRIQLHQNETNVGLCENWNRILSRASGKYVKLLCADDLIYPDCLSRQVAILENPANATVALTLGSRDIINARGEVILRRKASCGRGRVSAQELFRKTVRRGTNLIGEPAAVLFRKEALDKSGQLDTSNPFAIDLALWAALLKSGDAFVDPEFLAAFRVSAGAASTEIGLKQAGFFRQFVRDYRREARFEVTPLDVVSGYALSLVRCFLRNLFIRFHSRRAVDSSPRAGTGRLLGGRLATFASMGEPPGNTPQVPGLAESGIQGASSPSA
jgi:glycosyltransferase involved in cell wall biosynthesis